MLEVPECSSVCWMRVHTLALTRRKNIAYSERPHTYLKGCIMEINEIVDTVTVDAQKRFYSLATVVGAAVAGSLATAGAVAVVEVVKRRKAKKVAVETLETTPTVAAK